MGILAPFVAYYVPWAASQSRIDRTTKANRRAEEQLNAVLDVLYRKLDLLARDMGGDPNVAPSRRIYVETDAYLSPVLNQALSDHNRLLMVVPSWKHVFREMKPTVLAKVIGRSNDFRLQVVQIKCRETPLVAADLDLCDDLSIRIMTNSCRMLSILDGWINARGRSDW